MDVSPAHPSSLAEPSGTRRLLDRAVALMGLLLLAMAIALGLHDYTADARPGTLPLVALPSDSHQASHSQLI